MPRRIARRPNGHTESLEDTSGGARTIRFRVERIRQLVDEADFDDDTRPSVEIYIDRPREAEIRPPAPETFPPIVIPKAWAKWAAIAFSVGAGIAGLALGLLKLL